MAVLALAPILARAQQDSQTVAAGDAVVAADAGDPVTLSGVIAETTSTLYEAPTTAAPTTEAPTTTAAPAADGELGLHETAYVTTTTAAPPSTTAPATTQAPTTTAAPATTQTAAPTTAAPTTTTSPPTTSAPTTTAADKHPCADPVDNGGYAYEDPRSTQVWCDLAQCEAWGDWSLNTGNGYYGGLQFSLSSWQSVGGSGYPHKHPAATQIEMGRRLQARQGWGAWPHCSSELGLR